MVFSMPASGQPAAASFAATRWTFSGPASWWVNSEMNASISSLSIWCVCQRRRAVGGDVADDLLDLLLGQGSGTQQSEQRNAIGPGNALGVAGPEPVQNGGQKRGVGHVAKSHCCPTPTPLSGRTVSRSFTGGSRITSRDRAPIGAEQPGNCVNLSIGRQFRRSSCRTPVLMRPSEAELQRRGPIKQSDPNQDGPDDH